MRTLRAIGFLVLLTLLGSCEDPTTPVEDLAVLTTSLPDGTQAVAYSETLAATGGSDGYTWSISAGSLPDGLALSGSGTISGTPTAAGTSRTLVNTGSIRTQPRNTTRAAKPGR